MKKIFSLMLAACFCLFLAACKTTVIPTSAEAKEKMEKLGYLCTVNVQYGEEVATYGITQVTILTADQDDEYIQVYFFANQEDTDRFFQQKAATLTDGVNIVKKNRYSIYRGTEKAIGDSLS
jgi:lipopolysaccharide export LptBFGC system permease protein LptF